MPPKRKEPSSAQKTPSPSPKRVSTAVSSPLLVSPISSLNQLSLQLFTEKNNLQQENSDLDTELIEVDEEETEEQEEIVSSTITPTSNSNNQSMASSTSYVDKMFESLDFELDESGYQFKNILDDSTFRATIGAGSFGSLDSHYLHVHNNVNSSEITALAQQMQTVQGYKYSEKTLYGFKNAWNHYQHFWSKFANTDLFKSEFKEGPTPLTGKKIALLCTYMRYQFRPVLKSLRNIASALKSIAKEKGWIKEDFSDKQEISSFFRGLMRTDPDEVFKAPPIFPVHMEQLLSKYNLQASSPFESFLHCALASFGEITGARFDSISRICLKHLHFKFERQANNTGRFSLTVLVSKDKVLGPGYIRDLSYSGSYNFDKDRILYIVKYLLKRKVFQENSLEKMIENNNFQFKSCLLEQHLFTTDDNGLCPLTSRKVNSIYRVTFSKIWKQRLSFRGHRVGLVCRLSLTYYLESGIFTFDNKQHIQFRLGWKCIESVDFYNRFIVEKYLDISPDVANWQEQGGFTLSNDTKLTLKGLLCSDRPSFNTVVNRFSTAEELAALIWSSGFKSQSWLIANPVIINLIDSDSESEQEERLSDTQLRQEWVNWVAKFTISIPKLTQEAKLTVLLKKDKLNSYNLERLSASSQGIEYNGKVINKAVNSVLQQLIKENKDAWVLSDANMKAFSTWYQKNYEKLSLLGIDFSNFEMEWLKCFGRKWMNKEYSRAYLNLNYETENIQAWLDSIKKLSPIEVTAAMVFNDANYKKNISKIESEYQQQINALLVAKKEKMNKVFEEVKTSLISKLRKQRKKEKSAIIELEDINDSNSESSSSDEDMQWVQDDYESPVFEPLSIVFDAEDEIVETNNYLEEVDEE